MGATPIVGSFMPGIFTNEIQAAFRKSQLLVVADPRPEHDSVTQADYVNLPTISLFNRLFFVPCMAITIPDNKGAHSVDLRWWLLAHVVLYIYVMISCEYPWHVMLHLYYYRYVEGTGKESKMLLRRLCLRKNIRVTGLH